MITRSIETSDAKIEPLSDGRVVVRDGGTVEVIRPPRGAVRFFRTGRRATIAFGSPTKTTLVVNGTPDDLEHVFHVLTGVTA